eukprot:CAMPEP_0180560006 /NCGR_PEP_ID=MMETSP1037_2-20121125/2607_1 /TAXON_ID=632150 /ORGANISM="Azadinium spinosum, Strain 3D9" /LENGTH=107 /DNA_ID=CAMNT_0022576531 /DNA_START=286 /DNA_END=610 /DNA_ORIENTATION=-
MADGPRRNHASCSAKELAVRGPALQGRHRTAGAQHSATPTYCDRDDAGDRGRCGPAWQAKAAAAEALLQAVRLNCRTRGREILHCRRFGPGFLRHRDDDRATRIDAA